MPSEKVFLMFLDLDSTFEEYTKKDVEKYCNKSDNQFENFVKFIKKFEKNYNLNIKIHFISGVDKNDLKNRLNFFAKNFPDTIFKLIDDSMITGGIICNKYARQIGKIESSKETRTKADGINFFIRYYQKSSISGACFIGDSKPDLPAFEIIKEYHFSMGGFALACRSAYDYEFIKNKVDFYSPKPRILGCVEVLEKMDKFIKNRDNFNKK